MNFKQLGLFILIFIIVISCTVLNIERDHKGLNIFCLLNADIDTQRIIVDTIAGIDSGSDTCYHVGNANVYINDTKCLFARPDSNKSGYYIYTLPIEYGERCDLKLYYKGDTIEESTKIPDSIIIHYPISGSTIILDSLAFISWSHFEGICIIEIKKNSETLFGMSMYQMEDTKFPLILISPFFESGVAYDFSIIKPDSNYMGYNFGIDVLEGSEGVFGSYSISIVESVTVIK